MTEPSSLITVGGWVLMRLHGRHKARLLLCISLGLLLPALAGGVYVLAHNVMGENETSTPLSLSVQVACWAAIAAEAIAWIATLVLWLVEKPSDFEIEVRNPDYDPKNLY